MCNYRVCDDVVIKVMTDAGFDTTHWSLTRVPGIGSGSHTAEIVTLDKSGEMPIQIYIKTNSAQPIHVDGTHRRGVSFEAQVYRDVISRLDLPTVRYFGSYEHPESSVCSLFIEYLNTALRINKVSSPSAMKQAAS